MQTKRYGQLREDTIAAGALSEVTITNAAERRANFQLSSRNN